MPLCSAPSFWLNRPGGTWNLKLESFKGMLKKIDVLRGLMAAGDWREAIGYAAAFPRLGAHKAAIERAHLAYTNPRFAAQIKLDIEAAKAAGVEALKARYLTSDVPD